MTVNINKPQINLREQLKKLERPATSKLAVKGHDGVLLDPLTGELSLQALDSVVGPGGDTPVDVFVYNTSKDSDGGAWRKRTQNTSWYTETLNTSTRGSRRDFPAVAVIVAEDAKLTIYDGDDPDLPMWMVFNLSGAVGAASNMLPRGGSGSESDITSIACLNARLAVGLRDVSGSVGEGLVVIDFISELARVHRSTSSGYTGAIYGTPISGRNSMNAYNGDYNELGIIHEAVRDVAMTVLPSAPIDSATGLPIPTIAVATNNGTSVIKDGGNVVDFNDALGSTRPISTVAIRGNDIVHWNINNGTLQQFFDALTATADSSEEVQYNYTASGGHATCENISALLRKAGDGPYLIATRDSKSIASGAQSGMSVFVDGIDRNIVVDNQSIFDSRVAYITSDYNTGWMHGDIRGSFLSDTDPLGEELIVNGTFDSNIDNWRSYNASLSHATDSIRVGDGPGSWSKAYQAFDTVIGKQYQVKIVVKAISGGTATASVGATNPARLGGNDTTIIDSLSSTGTYYGEFTATATTSYVEMASDGTNYVDYSEVSVRNAVVDRSIKSTNLRQYGDITKTPVATGADLVAYSGFTGSSYLTYSASNIGFGTGDFSVSVWCIPSTDQSNEFILELNDASDSNRFYLLTTNTTTKRLYLPWDTDVAGSELNAGKWNHIVVGRMNGYGFVYVNNKWISDGYKPFATNLESNGRGTIGNYSAGPTNDYAWSGSLALLRISGSVPSAEQVKKMYDDEKVLFQENAKCTLYGSSDAVTALAYDTTTSLLHVGTSGGRSTFSGLKRIENTTTAVTTAISASNGLVAEQ